MKNNEERYFIDKNMNNQICYMLLNIDNSQSTRGHKHNNLKNVVQYLEKEIFNSELLYSTVLESVVSFNNKVDLVKPFGMVNKEQLNINQPDGMTSYYESLYRSSIYMLNQIKTAQSYSITAKGAFIFTITDGLPTDTDQFKNECLKVMEYAKKKGIIYIALALEDGNSENCDINLLKSEHDYVFRATNSDGVRNFFEKVVLKSISIVSQSVSGSQYNVPGTSIVEKAEIEIIDDSKLLNDEGFMEC